MAIRRKKRTSAKAGCLLWIVALIVLLIVFLVKFEDIQAVVQKTGFMDALRHAVSKPTTVQTSEPSKPEQQTSPQETAPQHLFLRHLLLRRRLAYRFSDTFCFWRGCSIQHFRGSFRTDAGAVASTDAYGKDTHRGAILRSDS